MTTLEALCVAASEKKRYWPYLDMHVKLWWIKDKIASYITNPYIWVIL